MRNYNVACKHRLEDGLIKQPMHKHVMLYIYK